MKNLTKLELAWPRIDDNSGYQFLSDIGNSCPTVKHLKLGNKRHPFDFFMFESLALVIGDRTSLFPSGIMRHPNGIAQQFQFAEENVTGICRSLESLSVWSTLRTGPPPVMLSRRMRAFPSSSLVSFMAFLLRHIPRLQKLGVSKIYSKNNLDSDF